MAHEYQTQHSSPPFQRKRNGNGRNFQHRKRQRNHKNPPIEEKPKISCLVCAVEEPKYKCPKCAARYCSVACCKKHKEVCPGIPGNATATNSEGTKSQESHKNEHANQNSKYLSNRLDMEQTMAEYVTKRQEQLERDEYKNDNDDDSVDEGWKITEEMKRALFDSEWLREELKDGGLRLLIGQVVSTPHGPRKHQVLQEIKERYPSFGVFVDKLLYLTGVLENDDEGEKGTVSKEVLEADWTEVGMRPTLALKSKEKPKMPIFEPVSQSSSEEEESGSESSSSEEEDSSSSEEESDSSDD